MTKTAKITVRPREAAAILSVSERKLLTMCNTEGLPFVKSGRAKLFKVSDLILWLDQQKKAGGENGILN